MILKSFFRKKIIKLYFLIFVLIFISFFTLFFLRDKYISDFNENYKNSFIYLETNDNVDLHNVDGIVDFKDCINYGGNYVLVSEENLDYNEVILYGNYNLNDIENVILDDVNTYELNVVNFIESDSVLLFNYVNKDMFDTLVKDKNIKGYYIKIDNFYEAATFVEILREKYNGECYEFYTSLSNFDYELFFANLELYTKLLFIVFIIISIVVIYNILKDHKEVNYLYNILGFKRNNIIFNNFFNIILLYFLSFVFSLIIVFIILTVFKF